MHKHSRIILIIVGILVVVGAVWYVTRPRESGTYKIGWIGPLTGPSAVLGMDSSKAVELAVKEANDNGGIGGKKIEAIFEDDEYLPRNTVTAYQKLVSVDHVNAVLAVTYGGMFAIADQAQKDGVVVINPLDCNDQIAALNDNIFCIATESESIGIAIAEDLNAQNIRSAGVLYSTKDEFMSVVANAFKKHYQSLGGAAIEESYVYSNPDFRTQLTKLNEAHPGALVLLGHDEIGNAMKQARDLGMTAKFWSLGTVTSPGLQGNAKGYAEGTRFAFWEPTSSTLVDAFNTNYQAFAGRLPILALTAYPAYDSANVLIEAFKQNSGSAPDIMKYLYALKNHAGTSGNITIGSDGSARFKEVIYILKDGKPVRAK